MAADVQTLEWLATRYPDAKRALEGDHTPYNRRIARSAREWAASLRRQADTLDKLEASSETLAEFYGEDPLD